MKRKQVFLFADNSYLFGYLFFLTGFFILLEISVLIQGSEIYLGDYKLVADHLKIPLNVIPGIIYFILVQLLLHLVFVLLIGFQAVFAGRVLNVILSSTNLFAKASILNVFKLRVSTGNVSTGNASTGNVSAENASTGNVSTGNVSRGNASTRTTQKEALKIEKLGLFLWFCGILFILVANQHFFPNSKFAHVSNILIWPKIEVIFLILVSSILILFLVLAVIGAFIQWPQKITASVLIGLMLIAIITYWPKSIITDASTEQRPNIILIGIDSLRPDFLGYFGYEKQTPSLDRFLSQSTVFTEAMTPLARTFPAWVSILNGQYPKHSGVRFNLPTLEVIQWDNTLPSILRKQGYETIFSTDETRFSNIDESYGFDQTLTPPIGFNDFLLGNLNDFPLANLVVNTPLGKYLFPHSYGNRPVFTTYNPNTFLDFIKPELIKSRTKPLFFAIHFCLPHFPYFWGLDQADDKSIRNYQASIKRVDQQFQDFLGILKESQILNHAIVVVLSDHGEAIELPGDRVTEEDLFVQPKRSYMLPHKPIPHFYPKAFDFETVNQSAGHGTDVLGLTQYHVLLVFRTFGLSKSNQIRNVTTRASLLDIKPTVLDFINVSSVSKTDGLSLKSSILEQKVALDTPRHFFYESDFSPQAVRSVHPETRKLLFEGIEYFQVNPETGRISVKKSMEHLILSSKQFADLYGEWVLALYPQNKTSMMPILVNLKTGYWTNDMDSTFAKHSPAQVMLKSLREFYGKDVRTVE